MDEKVITCWILAAADDFEDLTKGRVEVVIQGSSTKRLTFYPLSSKVLDKLQRVAEEHDR